MIATPGFGVMFAPVPQARGWRLCGVDLDGCLDGDKLAPWASAVVDRFNSYTERSPSGTGAHILFLCRDSDMAALRDAGLVTPKGGAEFSLGGHIEIALFLGGRYFTVTEDQLGDESTIRPVKRADLEWLIRDHGPAFKRQAGKVSPKGGDESGSGIGFKYLCDRFREGMSEKEARDEIAQDDGDAGAWWHRAGDRQQDRTLQNAWARITGEGAEIIALFDDLDDPDVEAAHILGIDPPGTDVEFELDEDGVIRAFTAAHKDELRFDHAAGSWFRFDGNSWRREETKLAHHYARQLATSMADDDPKAKPLRKVHVWEAIERGARTVREFVATSADWNRDPWLLGTPRGTVDLRTGVLREGDPAVPVAEVESAWASVLRDVRAAKPPHTIRFQTSKGL